MIIDCFPNKVEKSKNEWLKNASKVWKVIIESVNYRCMLNNILWQKEIWAKHVIFSIIIIPSFPPSKLLVAIYLYNFPIQIGPVVISTNLNGTSLPIGIYLALLNLPLFILRKLLLSRYFLFDSWNYEWNFKNVFFGYDWF